MRLFHTLRLRTTSNANFVDNSVDKLSNSPIYDVNNSANPLFLLITRMIRIHLQKMIRILFKDPFLSYFLYVIWITFQIFIFILILFT